MSHFLCYLSWNYSLWFPWRETSWRTRTECSQIPVCHRSISPGPQGKVKVTKHTDWQTTFCFCFLMTNWQELVPSHRQPAARPRTTTWKGRQRPSTSTPDRVGVFTERREKQGTSPRRAVMWNMWTEVKDVTTQPIKQKRSNLNKTEKSKDMRVVNLWFQCESSRLKCTE